MNLTVIDGIVLVGRRNRNVGGGIVPLPVRTNLAVLFAFGEILYGLCGLRVCPVIVSDYGYVIRGIVFGTASDIVYRLCLNRLCPVPHADCKVPSGGLCVILSVNGNLRPVIDNRRGIGSTSVRTYGFHRPAYEIDADGIGGQQERRLCGVAYRLCEIAICDLYSVIVGKRPFGIARGSHGIGFDVILVAHGNLYDLLFGGQFIYNRYEYRLYHDSLYHNRH